ncbi:MAG: metallophosphoesterase family protein [Candidatus Delongbacteria bacterium]|nr:metallophosphoesterase family protein [Candidatus Delongbacteria bacterium]
MKIAVVSDIHSNLEALTEVLKEIESIKVDAIYCLGDIVGYGPQPNECIDLIKSVTDKVVVGNHDSAVINQTDMMLFNSYARESTEWTRRMITDENYEYLLKLPLKISENDLLFVHSTPLIPEDWNYILTQHSAEKHFNYFTEQACFIGHSHRPEMFRSIDDRLIINVGSVGQPRDGNSKASFVVYGTDSGEYELIRKEYDIKSVYKNIVRAGLNEFLGERLMVGR